MRGGGAEGDCPIILSACDPPAHRPNECSPSALPPIIVLDPPNPCVNLTSMHGPPRPSPSKMLRPPPLTASSPWPPVKIHSVIPPRSVDRLLFVASFARKRSDRTPSALKRQTRTQSQRGLREESKKTKSTRRIDVKCPRHPTPPPPPRLSPPTAFTAARG